MPYVDVTIETRDGICPASVFTPAASAGPWPAVIFFMDGFGIRPALREMAQRLADDGYLVLLPDLYYRRGRYTAKDPAQILGDATLRAALMSAVASLDRDRTSADVQAFIEFLLSRSDVAGDRYGTTGYCMGGKTALTAAGAFPDRFAAVASFHGGGLATDQAESPHHFLSSFGGKIYVAAAIEDPSFSEEQRGRLERTLTDANVRHAIETYPAHHGFAIADVPAFDRAAAERHWATLLTLLHEEFARGH